jgi:ankyrin repeat protein
MSDPWDWLFDHAKEEGEVERQRRQIVDRLWQAVQLCDLDGVAEVLSKEPTTARSIDLLHEAILRGSPQIVGMLLWNGAPPGEPDCSGITPLLLAARAGHDEIVRLLIQYGADPNVLPEDIDPEAEDHIRGESPLLFAALWGQQELVRYLWSRTRPDVREKARTVMRNRLRLLDENDTNQESDHARSVE